MKLFIPMAILVAFLSTSVFGQDEGSSAGGAPASETRAPAKQKKAKKSSKKKKSKKQKTS